MSEELYGSIIRLFLEKGFGFVCIPCGRTYFFHVKQWGDPLITPVIGQQIRFTLGPGRPGRPEQCMDIRVIKNDIVVGTDALSAAQESKADAGVK